MLISIVISVCNEEESLGQLIKEIDRVLRSVEYKIEVLFVNDASTDNSESTLEEIKETYSYVKIITLDVRSGQTGCYQTAFQQARGKYIIRMDADLQDDPQDLFKFFPLIEKEVDLIMGLREMRRHRKLLRLASILYDALVVSLFDSPLHANTSSFVAFKSKFIKGIKFKKNDHRYIPLIAMRRGASNIKEVVVAHRERLYGHSKYGTFKKVFLGIQEVLRFFLRLKFGYYNLQNSNLQGSNK